MRGDRRPCGGRHAPSRRAATLGGAGVVVAMVAAAFSVGGSVRGPSAGAATAAAASNAGPNGCDVLDAKECLFPFPDDAFTVSDPSTVTGRRVDFPRSAMPQNQAGIPIDPSAWNHNDGFSPGSTVLTFVPGLDLARTGAAPVADLGVSLRPDAPIVLLDATAGRRVPYWAELDQSVSNNDQRSLLVHPAINFREGHRIVVALRRLETAAGARIPAGSAFRDYRDRVPTADPAIEARRAHFEAIFATLGHAGVARHDLYLAWDFTIASAHSLAGPMLDMRDDAFASLDQHAPAFQVNTVTPSTDPGVASVVTGTYTAPSYLTGTGAPGSRLNLTPAGVPQRTGDFTARFQCVIPRAAVAADGTVHPARPGIYGHGLLGNEQEVTAANVEAMANEHNFVFCATEWLGLSSDDVPNVVATAQDLSQFASIPDRLQQGILDTLFLGRLMIAPDGLVTNPAFRGANGVAVLDRHALFYDGNSLGGILGGATTAVAQDWTRAVLGVPGMNFSTLLQRSVDFDPYRSLTDQAYPDAIQRTLALNLLQMIWDRGEADGYAQHLTTSPYPGTPRHTVLLDEAFGDQQVANVATEVEARTIGARAHRPALTAGRSPDRTPLWGIPTLAASPAAGSALVLWDSGSPAPPPGNVPSRAGVDPHEDPRASKAARVQKSAFLRVGGTVIDVCAGHPCTASHAVVAPVSP